MSSSIIPFTSSNFSVESLKEINSGTPSPQTIYQISHSSSNDLLILKNFADIHSKKNEALSETHLKTATTLFSVATIALGFFGVLATIFTLTLPISFVVSSLVAFGSSEFLILSVAVYNILKTKIHENKANNFRLIKIAAIHENQDFYANKVSDAAFKTMNISKKIIIFGFLTIIAAVSLVKLTGVTFCDPTPLICTEFACGSLFGLVIGGSLFLSKLNRNIKQI
jgi:hypothetical protein